MHEAAGDPRAIAYARIARHLTLPSDVPPREFRRVADEGSVVFEREGDERGLCLAWRLRGQASWDEGNVAGEEIAQTRALEHARRAGSHWEEASLIQGISIDLYWGPTPVSEAIRWCDDTLARAPDDRAIEMGVAHALAHMHARLGHFELARSRAVRSIEIAAESGQRHEAIVLREVAADVETLAGNHEAAERMLAEACDTYLALGKPNIVLEAFHAFTQVDAGQSVDWSGWPAWPKVESLDTSAAGSGDGGCASGRRASGRGRARCPQCSRLLRDH